MASPEQVDGLVPWECKMRLVAGRWAHDEHQSRVEQ
jgi:hypothetical protein